jgi:hypothetical protein
MANAGGAWDNGKKWVETGRHGGKGSDARKARIGLRPARCGAASAQADDDYGHPAPQ